MNYKKKIKPASVKWLPKYLINKFSILNGAKYFSLGIFQSYLVFIPDKKYIKYFTTYFRIESKKSNGMSEESIENIKESVSNFAPTFVDHRLLLDMTFNGHCLIKNNISIPKEVINLDIIYKLSPWLRNLNRDFILNNCLFGPLKPTKNADPDKFKHSDYGRGFYSRSEFSTTVGIMGRKVIIFGSDMSSSADVDNKNKDILILGEGPTQGLDETTLTAVVKYSINFTQQIKDLY